MEGGCDYAADDHLAAILGHARDAAQFAAVALNSMREIEKERDAGAASNKLSLDAHGHLRRACGCSHLATEQYLAIGDHMRDGAPDTVQARAAAASAQQAAEQAYDAACRAVELCGISGAVVNIGHMAVRASPNHNDPRSLLHRHRHRRRNGRARMPGANP